MWALTSFRRGQRVPKARHRLLPLGELDSSSDKSWQPRCQRCLLARVDHQQLRDLILRAQRVSASPFPALLLRHWRPPEGRVHLCPLPKRRPPSVEFCGLFFTLLSDLLRTLEPLVVDEGCLPKIQFGLVHHGHAEDSTDCSSRVHSCVIVMNAKNDVLSWFQSAFKEFVY